MMDVKKRKRIHPVKEICPCRGKITNHHNLCDKCWEKENSPCQKIVEEIKKMEKLMAPRKNKIKKLKEELKRKGKVGIKYLREVNSEQKKY
jgi:hypothetical protein